MKAPSPIIACLARAEGCLMRRVSPGLRLVALGLLLLTAACGGQGRNQAQIAQDYARHSRTYTPPGPAHDPWGPYIVEAAREFDVPERWIREVMRVESGGRQDAVSPVGAMGLVQVMPATYEELRGRYDLGSDPFHPRDNIRAGTAYMREMYDRFGAPGFLAAYNAGPRGLERWLYEGRPLPAETRNYVAMIAPRIRGLHPERRVAPENIAMVPETIAPGPRFPPRRGAPVMLASARRPARAQVAAAPPPAARPAVVAAAPAPAPMVVIGGAPSSPSRFSLIPSAHAAPVLRAPAGGPSRWAVQVGAFASESLARSTAAEARRKSRDLAGGLAFVVPTEAARNRLWRARVGGLSRDDAMDACAALKAQRWQCTVLSPDAQS
jgi:cell division septation protein DedD